MGNIPSKRRHIHLTMSLEDVEEAIRKSNIFMNSGLRFDDLFGPKRVVHRKNVNQANRSDDFASYNKLQSTTALPDDESCKKEHFGSTEREKFNREQDICNKIDSCNMLQINALSSDFRIGTKHDPERSGYLETKKSESTNGESYQRKELYTDIEIEEDKDESISDDCSSNCSCSSDDDSSNSDDNSSDDDSSVDDSSSNNDASSNEGSLAASNSDSEEEEAEKHKRTKSLQLGASASELKLATKEEFRREVIAEVVQDVENDSRMQLGTSVPEPKAATEEPPVSSINTEVKQGEHYDSKLQPCVISSERNLCTEQCSKNRDIGEENTEQDVESYKSLQVDDLGSELHTVISDTWETGVDQANNNNNDDDNCRKLQSKVVASEPEACVQASFSPLALKKIKSESEESEGDTKMWQTKIERYFDCLMKKEEKNDSSNYDGSQKDRIPTGIEQHTKCSDVSIRKRRIKEDNKWETSQRKIRRLQLDKNPKRSFIDSKPNNFKPAYKCDICGKEFKIPWYLTLHKARHPKVDTFKCAICKKNFVSSKDLMKHMGTHSPSSPCGKALECNSNSLHKVFKLSVNLSSPKKRRRYKCDQCEESFRYHTQLKTHITRKHCNEKPFSCSVCNKGFVLSHDLTCHLRVHSNERPYECTECNKKFKRSNHLVKHMMIHKSEQPYQCPVCDKRFRQSTNLKTHMLHHSDENTFVCGICNRQFKQVSTLLTHMKHHSNVRPHKCADCERTFIQASDLMAHMRIHTGERPYKCDLCQKQFVRKTHLTKHNLCCSMKVEKKPHKCDVCKEAFRNPNALEKHMKCHNIDLPYECDICWKRYTYVNHLRNHKRSHERKENTDTNS